jgi:hypothetical protein
MSNLARTSLVFGMAALGGLFFVGMIYVASLFIARDPKQIHGAMIVAMVFWLALGAIYSLLLYREVRRIAATRRDKYPSL